VPERLPAAVEAAVYFVVAEGLANIGKYSGAQAASVAVRAADGEVEVLVADDGRGGATLDAGGGLRGLQDRVAAVGGRLSLDSPPGGGTRLGARIPYRGRRAEPTAPEVVAA
jgi:signal transduction histidine kinase